jgi:hypothetical protein
MSLLMKIRKKYPFFVMHANVTKLSIIMSFLGQMRTAIVAAEELLLSFQLGSPSQSTPGVVSGITMSVMGKANSLIS